MSVPMALAKLCACACGGTVIGGSAVHVAERPQHVAYSNKMAKRVVCRQVASRPRVCRVVTRTTTNCASSVVTVSTQAPTVPVLAALAPSFIGGGGGFVPGVIDGGLGFGGGGSGAGVVVSSTSSSSSGGAVVDIDNSNTNNNSNEEKPGSRPEPNQN